VDSVTRKKWFFTKPTSRKNVLEIPKGYRSGFEKKQIDCIEYHGLDESDERDIFQRVQLGMSLSSAEKQKAIMSPWTLWFDDLVQKYVSGDGIPHYINWNTKRERDFQCIGLLVMVCYYLPEYKGAVPAKLKDFIASPEQVGSVFKGHVQTVLSIFHTLVANPEFNNVITAAATLLAPIEFVFIGALISHSKLHASAELAGMVYQFRSYVRKQHKDIRMNESVSRTMYNWIMDPNNVSADPERFESITFSPKKRKRDRLNDDDDYRPGRDD